MKNIEGLTIKTTGYNYEKKKLQRLNKRFRLIANDICVDLRLPMKKITVIYGTRQFPEFAKTYLTTDKEILIKLNKKTIKLFLRKHNLGFNLCNYQNALTYILAHELVHAKQFLTMEIDWSSIDSDTEYGILDEEADIYACNYCSKKGKDSFKMAKFLSKHNELTATKEKNKRKLKRMAKAIGEVQFSYIFFKSLRLLILSTIIILGLTFLLKNILF